MFLQHTVFQSLEAAFGERIVVRGVGPAVRFGDAEIGEQQGCGLHERMPVILDWRDAGAWIMGESPGALPRPAPEDALQEWIVSPRVSKAGVGDDDPRLMEPVA